MMGRVTNSILPALRKSWPRVDRFGVSDLETFLTDEIGAFLAGETAHLPYVASAAQTTWMTVSLDASGLRVAITGLRAWVIPSLGWEYPKRPIVAPTADSGELANPLASVSPAGYYRSHSTTAVGVTTVVEKLAAWRRLRKLRPLTANVVNRSLFELREQFYLAVATGDRTLAEESVEAIDHRQLDTDSNTFFMRTRIRARFGSHDQIVHDPNLDRMLSLRLPKITANSIIEAFSSFICDLCSKTVATPKHDSSTRRRYFPGSAACWPVRMRRSLVVPRRVGGPFRWKGFRTR